MIETPHNTTDLLLAPVALALDQQLDQLAALDESELTYLIALTTDREPTNRERRRELLLQCLTREVDTHQWSLTWSDRGLCLSHDDRRLVLGLPESVRTFLS